jgi:hypothetical protein
MPLLLLATSFYHNHAMQQNNKLLFLKMSMLRKAKIKLKIVLHHMTRLLPEIMQQVVQLIKCPN